MILILILVYFARGTGEYLDIYNEYVVMWVQILKIYEYVGNDM